MTEPSDTVVGFRLALETLLGTTSVVTRFAYPNEALDKTKILVIVDLVSAAVGLQGIGDRGPAGQGATGRWRQWDFVFRVEVWAPANLTAMMYASDIVGYFDKSHESFLRTAGFKVDRVTSVKPLPFAEEYPGWSRWAIWVHGTKDEVW